MAKLMKNTTPFLVGIVGGASAGKSTVCTSLMQRLVKSNKKVVVLAQSSFVKPNVPEVDLDDHPGYFLTTELIYSYRKRSN
uniref:Uncharacterized protein n=1 Tax=Plectus sambesii TaxID=2011161 RepID=A0A914WFR3_9BILA